MEEEGEEEGKVEKEGWEAGSLESALHGRLIGEVSLPCPPFFVSRGTFLPFSADSFS